MQPIVAYYRVSTKRQGRSGLGLDAQRECCAAAAVGNDMEVADAFAEVETGKGSDALSRRPQLAAVLAEKERRMISERTRVALTARKRRSARLGNPVDLAAAGATGAARAAAGACRVAENVAPVIREIRASGVASLHGIAVVLNTRGVRTARGGRWAATQVGAVLGRTES